VLHVWRNGAEFCAVPLTHRAALNIIGSLTAAMQMTEAPKVKPLEWIRSEHKQPDQIGYHAKAICGPYAIWTNKAQISFVASSAGYFSMVTDTLEAAKAAAQADYEARILSALVQP
jgi:hypothetical protein